MTEEQFNKLFEDLPDKAIQKTSGSQTKKGYDTIGYGYQYCVDRFNNVLGENWGFSYDIIDHVKGTYKSGTPYHEVTVNINIWVRNKDNPRSCVGSHTAINFGDALKGAITNGFKKTAAFWGVGAKAYRGEMDDDNKPLPESYEQKKNNDEKQKGDINKARQIISSSNDVKSTANYLNNWEWEEPEREELRELLKVRDNELNSFDNKLPMEE